MTDNFIEDTTRQMARKAIAEGRIWNYMLFWQNAPEGQCDHARKILREELAK